MYLGSWRIGSDEGGFRPKDRYLFVPNTIPEFAIDPKSLIGGHVDTFNTLVFLSNGANPDWRSRNREWGLGQDFDDANARTC